MITKLFTMLRHIVHKHINYNNIKFNAIKFYQFTCKQINGNNLYKPVYKTLKVVLFYE